MSRASTGIIALLLLGAAALPCRCMAQDKYGSRNGTVTFFSDAPLEDITAVNRHAASVLVLATGAIEFSVLIRAFEFEKAMMQEHFNENYLESRKFPKAVFKGRLVARGGDDLAKAGMHDADVEGLLTIHGVERQLHATATLSVGDQRITAKSTFQVRPADHGITIPAIVREKIAKEIQVTVDITYLKL